MLNNFLNLFRKEKILCYKSDWVSIDLAISDFHKIKYMIETDTHKPEIVSFEPGTLFSDAKVYYKMVLK